jgi:hypothetical protein
MDCHETNSTTWKLMGVFKEASYFGNDAFFEQLFKHEGVCVWNDDNLYSFMSTARKNYWPTGCTSTGIKITNTYSNDYGSYLYIDLRPTWNGNMTYGLYSDEVCKTEYDLPDKDIDSITKSMGLLYGSYLQKWNDGLEAFKVCQPCKAYNLKNNYASSNYYGSYSDSSDPNAGYFQCYDDADYTNVNQCMKFRTHAQLEVCTWEDLVTATNQGGILEVKVGDTVFGSERMTAEEYKYLVKAQKESNLKASKAEAQTVAMYRRESEKVAAMKPGADRWNSLGGLTLAIGTMFLFGAVFWVGKGYIDRAMPKKTLVEPLLAPNRDFLGQEMAEHTTEEHPSIPFGNGSDEESVVNRPDLLDDNSSVSSLSYTSAMQDPTKSEPSNFVPDALEAWYAKVDDDSAKDAVSTAESKVNGDEEFSDIVSPSNTEQKSIDSSVFDGIDATHELQSIHHSHLIGEFSNDEEGTLDSDCVYMDQEKSPENNVDTLVDPIVSVESSADENLEDEIKQTDLFVDPIGTNKSYVDEILEDEIKETDLAEEMLPTNVSEVHQDKLFSSIDHSKVPTVDDAQDATDTEGDEVLNETPDTETASDILFTIDDSEMPSSVHVDEEVASEEVVSDFEEDPNLAKGTDEDSAVDPLVFSREEQENTKEISVTEILETKESESKSDEIEEVAGDSETVHISNVSLNDTSPRDQDLPDEMIQYLSMSASEQSNGHDEDIEAGEQIVSFESQREEAKEESVDDKTDEPPSI